LAGGQRVLGENGPKKWAAHGESKGKRVGPAEEKMLKRALKNWNTFSYFPDLIWKSKQI
jgi:hypothetical protein